MGVVKLKITPKILSRFWSKVDVKSHDECWLWKAGRDKDGYGKFTIKELSVQRHLRAHRVSYFLANAEHEMEGHEILHSCDTPACVNPKHLKLGSQKENIWDAIKRGRTKKSKSGKYISTEIALQMVEMAKDKNVRFNDIANKFGFPYTQVSAAIDRHRKKLGIKSSWRFSDTLSAIDKVELLESHKSGVKIYALAKKYGVDFMTIKLFLTRNS